MSSSPVARSRPAPLPAAAPPEPQALATARPANQDTYVACDPSRFARATGTRGATPVPRSLLSETAVKNAVVVGAGPAGLLAALELVQNGVSVTLIEQRSAYTRPIHWNVRADLLHRIAETCPVLLQRVLDRLGTIESVERIDATKTSLPPQALEELRKEKPDDKVSIGPGGLRFQHKGPAIPAADAQLARFGARQMLTSPSVGQILTVDLENIFFDELRRLEVKPRSADEPRVTILRNHRCDLEDSADKPGWSACTAYEVRECESADGKMGFTPTGKRLALGTPDLVVNCEGANSLMREQAGIARTHASPATRFIAASIADAEITPDAPHGGLARRRYAELVNPEDGSVHGVRQVVLGSTAAKQRWVLVEVPPFVDLGSKEAIAAYFEEHAALLFGRSREAIRKARITWGPTPFTMQQFISATAVKGENVIFAGDAVGTAHFLTGGGVMTAAVPHMFALDKLLANLADGVPRRVALHRYDKWTMSATKAWLKLGFKEFGRQGEKGESFETAMANALERLQRAGASLSD